MTTDAAPWDELLEFTVELGRASRWSAGEPGPGRSRWDVNTWGPGGVGPTGSWEWGLSAEWEQIPPELVLGIVNVTGADDLVTTAASSTTTVRLWNRDGLLGADDAQSYLLGASLRVWAQQLPEGGRVMVAWGIVDRPVLGGTPQVPTVTLTAYDALSAWANGAVAGELGPAAETVTQRLHRCADAIGWPENGRDFAVDATMVGQDDGTNPLDCATRAVSSAGGILWSDPAEPVSIVRYRPASWVDQLVKATPELAIVVGEPAGQPEGVPVARPTDHEAEHSMGDLVNVVQLATQAAVPLTSHREDDASISRFGRRSAGPLSDLLLMTQAELDARAMLELTRSAWPRPTVSPLSVTVYDAGSAAAALLRFGAPVWVGRAPEPEGGANGYSFRAMAAGVSLDVSASSCTVSPKLLALETLADAQSARWGVARWSAGDTWGPL